MAPVARQQAWAPALSPEVSRPPAGLLFLGCGGCREASEISLLHRAWDRGGGRLCFEDSISCRALGEVGMKTPSLPSALGTHERRGQGACQGTEGAGDRARALETQVYLLLPVLTAEMIQMGQRGQVTDPRPHSR